MYNLAIRKCISPPLLAPRLKIFKWIFTTPPGIEPWTRWTTGRHATIWASTASLKRKYNKYIHMIQMFLKDNKTKCWFLMFTWGELKVRGSLSLLLPETVGSACCDQLKNATQLAIYFIYFSNRKITPMLGSRKHPINTKERSKLSYLKVFLVCYRLLQK